MNVAASDSPILYIFSGLPGSGKTVLARALARRLKAAYIRIDTIEQALRDLCALSVHSEGYGLAYRLAADNLRVGVSVVADSCNPLEITRRAWEQVAVEAGGRYLNIEIICSDVDEHRERVETRKTTVPGLKLPTWKEVESREYHAWTVDRVVVDTARRRQAESVDALLSELSRSAPMTAPPPTCPAADHDRPPRGSTIGGTHVSTVPFLSGSCLCGEIRVEILERPDHAPEACHCTQCRKQSGHVLAAVNVRRDTLRIHGEDKVAWYKSSDKVERGFCSICGSTLFWKPTMDGYQYTAVAMGALEAPTGMKLSKHTFVGDKGDYYEIVDGISQSDRY